VASVVIDSGELPSAEGVSEGHALAQVIGRWQSIAHGRFRDDCRFLLQMIDETDRLRLWEKNVGGFTFASRDEFLQKKVLIDYDLTERQTRQIVEALKRGDEAAARQTLTAAETIKAAPDLKPTGRPKGDDKGKESLPFRSKGPTVDRLAARIKRDHPEIAAKVEAGEYRSIRAAALDAGIVRPMKSIPVDSAESAVRALLRVFTIDQLVRAVGVVADQA
jgi:hypothetical protein